MTTTRPAVGRQSSRPLCDRPLVVPHPHALPDPFGDALPSSPTRRRFSGRAFRCPACASELTVPPPLDQPGVTDRQAPLTRPPDDTPLASKG